MENKVTLVVQRVKEGVKVIPGSKLFSCSRCNRAVWVAPTGLKKLEEGAEIICSDCFLSLKREAKSEEIAEITEEQLNELERVLGFRPSKEEMMKELREWYFPIHKEGR